MLKAVKYILGPFNKAAKILYFISGCLLLFTVMFIANKKITRIVNSGIIKEDPKEITPKQDANLNEIYISKQIVKKGDKFTSILKRENLENKDIKKIIPLAINSKSASKLQIGQIINFYYKLDKAEDSNFTKKLEKIEFDINKAKSISFVKNEKEEFSIKYVTPFFKKTLARYEVSIQSNLTVSLKNLGIDNNSINNLVKAYSKKINFNKNIKSGDRITVITEKFLDKDGNLSHHGNILYSTLINKGKEHKLYGYSIDDKDFSFFSEDGQNTRSNFILKPVKNARLSDKYGYRKKHPVLKCRKLHKGEDYAAPKGTPIMAASHGTVKFVGWKAGYGRLVVIQHSKEFSTAYAHASKFAKNLKVGNKVSQGQVIAYIGSTGRATGPHVHFETRINNKAVNPAKFRSLPEIKLAGKELNKFKKYKQYINELDKKLSNNIEIAENDLKIKSDES